jgi:soluble lytic murein transglycosylase
MRLSELSARALRSLAVSLVALTLGAGLVQAESAAVSALREATRDAARGDWEGAFAAAEEGGPVVQAILDWQALRDQGGEFREYAAFIEAHPDWPDLKDLRANGETSIPPNADPEAVLAFFGDELPQTGVGTRALARALTELGREDDARAMVEQVWLKQPLNDSGVTVLAGAFPEWLGPLHDDRAQAMLWRWRTSDAERMLPYLNDGQKTLVRARMALIRGNNAAALIAQLPASLRNHPGLAYDRYNHLAEDGQFEAALRILRSHDRSAETLGEPFRWAAYRAQIVRWLMREGRTDEAYRLAANHHLSEPSEIYADLEWLAGFLSLRKLDQPERALAHFQMSEGAVTGPISTARAAYWQGRAEDALGRDADAAFSFAKGARYQTAFYGLLSAERLRLSLDPTLTGQEDFGSWRSSEKLANPLTQAMLLLLAAGERDDARRFALQMARTLDRDALGQLANLLEEMHESYLAVLVGKAAVERGIVVPAAYFPLHPMARRSWPVGTDLALSIARRESEFSPAVSSPVGAQGLMQLMPGTAREVAGWLGLPYSQPRLNDWEYNAALGTRYLQDLQETFGSSPVLTAAGYNAGPGRPRQWMAQRGDIRDADVDVIDWIEHIPFAETRIYVMRVSESIPIYRARLTGVTGPVNFTALLKGEPPHIRPRARPFEMEATDLQPVERVSTSSVSAEIAQGAEAELAAEEPVAVRTGAEIRPRLRPDDLT